VTYRTILVNLEAGRSNTHLLDAAKQVAERFQATVIGSTACAPIQLLYGDGQAYGDIFEQDNKEIELEINVAEAEFRDAFGNQPCVLDWRSAVLMTSLSDHLAQEASRADLILTHADTAGSFNVARQVDTGALVMQAGRPVLVVAPTTAPFRMERFVLAWKNTRESARALGASLALLQGAGRVHVVCWDDDSGDRRSDDTGGPIDIERYLALHDVTATPHRHRSVPADVGGALLSFCADVGADLLVMGCYGHGRAREWVLGGATRTVLRSMTLPVLLAH